jgi:prepilin peptidase CpaA
MVAGAADAALVLIVCAAAWSDVRSRRIPNRLTVAGLVAALFLRVLLGVVPLQQGVLGAALALGISVVLFALGIIGGGDAKLLVAVGAFLGPAGFIGALAISCVVGAVMAVADAARRGVLLLLLVHLLDVVAFWRAFGRRGQARRLSTPGALTVPFGVAIAVGAIAWRLAGTEILGALRI